MRIKAIVTDLDLTITNEDRVIEPRVITTVQRLRKGGVEVILASGASIYSVQAVAHYIGATRAAVGENGGVISIDSDIVVLGDMDEPTKAYKALLEEFGEAVTPKRMKPRFTEIVLHRTIPLEQAKHVLRFRGLNAKIVDSKVAYHLMNADIDKGRGAGELLTRLGIRQEAVAVFGDGSNDLELFDAGQYRIALANSVEELKRTADWTSDEAFGEGFVSGIRHLAASGLIPRNLAG